MARTDTYVLDTSAVFAFTDDEPGADVVQTLLNRADAGEVRVLVSFMTLMEAYYLLWRRVGRAQTRGLLAGIQALPVTRVDASPDLIVAAGELKAQSRLSVADAWVAATAQQHAATLVHKDGELRQLGDLVAQLELGADDR
ncbi:MAG: PIN domain-containing protein [Armatimonadota bacterium]